MINSTPYRIAISASFLILACLFAMDSAWAQSYAMEVSIPFDFFVGDSLLPAGDYEVSALNNAVKLNSATTRSSAGIQTQPLKRVPGVVVSRELIFNRYGEGYFLCEMWWGRSSSSGRMVTISERETRLAKTLRPVRIEARAR